MSWQFTDRSVRLIADVVRQVRNAPRDGTNSRRPLNFRSICLIPCTVTQNLGDQGDATHPATWTYDVFDLGGMKLNTDPLSPTWARANGSVNKATHGTFYATAEDGIVLYQIDETPVTNSCGG